VAQDFHHVHKRRYGHAEEDAAIEVVNVRVRMTASTKKPTLARLPRCETGIEQACIEDGAWPIYDRRLLGPGHSLTGPVIVIEDYSTTLIPGSWVGTVDTWGNILCEKPA